MIHPAAQVGFSRSADAYERARPGYPEEAIEYLLSRLRAPRDFVREAAHARAVSV